MFVSEIDEVHYFHTLLSLVLLVGFDAGTLKVNVTITKNDIIYNIRNFLQLRSGISCIAYLYAIFLSLAGEFAGQTISCPPVHQTVNISADLNSHDGDIKSLRRIVEPQNLPMSVAKRNFERNQMSDGINSNRLVYD